MSSMEMSELEKLIISVYYEELIERSNTFYDPYNYVEDYKPTVEFYEHSSCE